MAQETIKVKIERTYKFVKDRERGCDFCGLYDFCNDVDWNECEGGEKGHYKIDDENIEQL